MYTNNNSMLFNLFVGFQVHRVLTREKKCEELREGIRDRTNIWMKNLFTFLFNLRLRL
jgi:uncharacterized membrane protein